MKATFKVKVLQGGTPPAPPSGSTRITLDIPADGLTWQFFSTTLADGHERGTLDWGDGMAVDIGSERSLAHTYDAPGRYVVRLTDDFKAICLSTNNPTYASKYSKRIIAFETDAKLYTELPLNCFKSCSNLQTFDVSDGAIRLIGTGAFSACSGLVGRIDLPHVAELAPTTTVLPFMNCTGLTEIHFAEVNKEAITSGETYRYNNKLGAPNAVVMFDL